MHSSRGLFISFEGSEGCGKSTQIQRLAARLRALNREILLTREPGGTVIGEKIRHLLQHDEAGDAMCPETELLLFTASRAQLARELIAPALETGKTVIADRFLDSTTVYQGVARRINPESVAAINLFAVGTIMPDVTFVLDLDNTTARERMRQRGGTVPDRMENQPAAFYEAVRQGYQTLAANDPKRVRLIDAAPDPDAVEAAIIQQLTPLLA